MTVKLNIPAPSSVQNPSTGKQTFRLQTEDGRSFTRLSRLDVITNFPAAISAHVAAGNDQVLLNDIPEYLHEDLATAFQAAGWFTKKKWFADLDMMPISAVPYSTVAYFSVPHLCWSAKPFPLTWEERLWQFVKSWLD